MCSLTEIIFYVWEHCAQAYLDADFMFLSRRYYSSGDNPEISVSIFLNFITDWFGCQCFSFSKNNTRNRLDMDVCLSEARFYSLSNDIHICFVDFLSYLDHTVFA